MSDSADRQSVQMTSRLRVDLPPLPERTGELDRLEQYRACNIPVGALARVLSCSVDDGIGDVVIRTHRGLFSVEDGAEWEIDDTLICEVLPPGTTITIDV